MQDESIKSFKKNGYVILKKSDIPPNIKAQIIHSIDDHKPEILIVAEVKVPDKVLFGAHYDSDIFVNPIGRESFYIFHYNSEKNKIDGRLVRQDISLKAKENLGIIPTSETVTKKRFPLWARAVGPIVGAGGTVFLIGGGLTALFIFGFVPFYTIAAASVLAILVAGLIFFLMSGNKKVTTSSSSRNGLLKIDDSEFVPPEFLSNAQKPAPANNLGEAINYTKDLEKFKKFIDPRLDLLLGGPDFYISKIEVGTFELSFMVNEGGYVNQNDVFCTLQKMLIPNNAMNKNEFSTKINKYFIKNLPTIGDPDDDNKQKITLTLSVQFIREYFEIEPMLFNTTDNNSAKGAKLGMAAFIDNNLKIPVSPVKVTNYDKNLTL